MLRMYLDESGNHDLMASEPQYPVFVLGGVIIDAEYADSVLSEKLSEFKIDVFGTPDVVLHTAEIARNKNAFECLRHAPTRERFYAGLRRLMSNLKYQVVACAILKEEHLRRYEGSAVDPYWLSLQIVAERFCYELGSHGTGTIIAECRRPELDANLERAYRTMQTRYLKANTIKSRITSLEIRPKAENIPGLQIADLVVSPIGRFVIGKTPKDDFEIIRSKFRGGATGFRGKGLVILPKN